MSQVVNIVNIVNIANITSEASSGYIVVYRIYHRREVF